MKPQLVNVALIKDEDVVEVLERALRRARGGEMTEVAIAGVMRGGGSYRASAGNNTMALIGAVCWLKNMLLTDAER